MPRKRLILIAFLLLAALAGIALSPAFVAGATRAWLNWQAHRQHLKIELGKLSAPLLRPVSIERVRVTNEAAFATQIDLTAEHATLRLNLARIVAGNTEGIHGFSIQNARAEVRRDFSGTGKPIDFNLRALQAVLPA